MARLRYLADTSVFSRLAKPSVVGAFAPLAAGGQIALCSAVAFELGFSSRSPADYAELLSRAGCEVDAWETTYVHILQGEDPVLEWYKGTGLRPVLAALDAERAGDFLAEYGTELRQAYPPRSFGTIFPFRRVFAVAHRPG